MRITNNVKFSNISFNEFRVRVMMFSTTSNNISAISFSFIGGGNLSATYTSWKRLTFSQVTENFYYILLNRVHLAMSFNEFQRKMLNCEKLKMIPTGTNWWQYFWSRSVKNVQCINIYILLLICFARMDFSEQFHLKGKTRDVRCIEMWDEMWDEVHFEQNISMVESL